MALALAVTAVTAATAATNDACVAAGCIGPYLGTGQQACGFTSGDYRCGQTFVPAFGGVLREIRVGLWSQPGTAVVQLRPTAGGVPTATVLAEATVPGSPYPGDRLEVADFSSQLLVLDAGVTYAFTLRTSGLEVVNALAAFPGCAPTTGTRKFVTSDDGGQTWAIYPSDNRSIAYQVCIDAATATTPGSWGRVKIRYR